MELGLENMVVVVTGGGKGICFACLRGRSESKMLAQGHGKVPLRRFAAPRDVGDLPLFLAVAKAACITGAIVPMDGGSPSLQLAWKRTFSPRGVSNSTMGAYMSVV